MSLVALAEHYQEKLIFGMEIREQVTNYVAKKVCGLRMQNPDSDRVSGRPL